jgi:hypothetical protein
MIAQYLIAFFFIAASLYKIESFFLDHDQTLRRHFEFWISLNLPPMWYRSLMFWMMGLPHGEQAMEASATLLQFIPAIMLLANYRTRLAGWLLAVIQVNIFLATFYHPNFNEFVGGSLWICLFFILRKNDGTWNKRAWQVLTGLLFVWAAVFVRNRFNAGDPWLSSVPWQRLHLQADVLSIAYPWKTMVLWLSGTTVGAILWAGVWWMELAATFLLLTRLRLYGGAALLIFAMLRTLTWMNSITSEGVLATLILFLWVAQEEALQHRSAQEKTIGFTKNTAV